MKSPPSPLIHIILDGFDSNYLISAPFLSKGIGNGKARRLEIPSPFGVRGMIFSGTLPGTNQDFTDLCRDPRNSRFRFLNLCLNSQNMLSNKKRFLIKILIRQISGAPCRIPESIPEKYLSSFDSLQRSRRFTTFKGEGTPATLIDYLKSNRIPFQYFGPPFSSFWRKPLSEIVHAIKPKSKYIFVHVVSPDLHGHKFGPEAKTTHSLIRQLDMEIETLCKNLKQKHSRAALIIHSDHGMSQVKQAIDFWDRIQKWPMTLGVDYDYFLDSTMARFWLLNKKKHNELIERIKTDLPEAKLLNDQDYRKSGMVGLDYRFGDFFAVLPENSIILPNFYQTKSVNGMHGYCDGKSKGIIAWYGLNTYKNIKEEISLIDIFPTIATLLKISNQNETDGAPFL